MGSTQHNTTQYSSHTKMAKENLEEWQKDIVMDMLLPKMFNLDPSLMRIKGMCQFCGHNVLAVVHRPALNGKLVQAFGCVECRQRYVVGYMHRVFPEWPC